MPTLRPQKLSGLVVTPTVELDGNIYRVSLAIDVGESRTGSPPPEVVSREDLVVELIAPGDGSLEPIASPDPGPLPVHALRVIQARGEFTFSRGVNAATELKVTLQGASKTFPLSHVFAPTGCLRREPKEGGPFEPSHATVNPILRRLPTILPIARRCCPRRFDAPVNSIADPAVKSESFEIEADFIERGSKCRCGCCQYRQFVRGTFTDASGNPVRFDMPSGALDPVRYCEDGSIDEFGPGKPGYYGHRDTSSPGDTYSPGAASGCTYRGDETASCPTTDTAHLEYLGMIIDRCHGKVVAKRKWVVDL